MNGQTYIRTEKTVEEHREIQSQLRAAREEASRELQAQQARCCCSDLFSRAVALAKTEENEAVGKGGDISPLSERETKAFWNGYWAAAHNISHGLEELARENIAGQTRPERSEGRCL